MALILPPPPPSFPSLHPPPQYYPETPLSLLSRPLLQLPAHTPDLTPEPPRSLSTPTWKGHTCACPACPHPSQDSHASCLLSRCHTSSLDPPPFPRAFLHHIVNIVRSVAVQSGEGGTGGSRGGGEGGGGGAAGGRRGKGETITSAVSSCMQDARKVPHTVR